MGQLTPEQSQLPTLPPVVQERLDLTSTVDHAANSARLLFSPWPEARACIVGLKGYAGELRRLCNDYLSERENRTAMSDCANKLIALCSDLAVADPRIGTPYYLDSIRSAARAVLAITQASQRELKRSR